MKIQANQARPGMVLEHEGRQYAVLKIQIISPGKGGAFIQVDMRDIKSGNKTNVRWRTQDTIEKLNVEEREATFLFGDADTLTFMDAENYEQFTIPREMLGEQAGFLQDGMPVTVDFVEGKPVSVTLPQTVVLEIVQADPVTRGQTASSSYKPAMLSNGMRILVPPHIEAGTRVVVNTAESAYVERAKD
jgi:elongation factor P